MARTEATQQSIEPTQDVPRFDLSALRVRRFFGARRQRSEQALTFPAAQRGFERVIGDPVDETAQPVGRAEGRDFLEHATKDVLSNVLRVGRRSEGALGGPE